MKWNFLAGLIKNSDNSNLTKTQQKNAMNIVDKNGTRMQRIIQSDVVNMSQEILNLLTIFRPLLIRSCDGKLIEV